MLKLLFSLVFCFVFASSCVLVLEHLLYCGEYEEAIPLILNTFLPWAAVASSPIKMLGLQLCFGSHNFAVFTQLRLLQV